MYYISSIFSDSKNKYAYSVFVACSEEDEPTGKDVYERLCGCGVKCAAEFDGVSHPGCAVKIKRTAEVIATSKHVVLIFSKNSCSQAPCSDNCTYQLILALDQLQHRSGKDVVIRILLDGVQHREVPLLQKGFLADLLKGSKSVCIDYDRNNPTAWVPKLVQSLNGKMIIVKSKSY